MLTYLTGEKGYVHLVQGQEVIMLVGFVACGVRWLSGLCGHVANAGCGSASRSCGGMALF